VLKLEKSLLDTRISLQLESDEKIMLMESEAEQKAAMYLADHTAGIEKENRQLQQELVKLTITTSRLIARKDQLIQENKELERQLRISKDLVKIRLDKMKMAEEKQVLLKSRRQRKIKLQREKFMNTFAQLQKTTMNQEELEIAVLGDWYDFDSEDD
jgi:hypothetical protein